MIALAVLVAVQAATFAADNNRPVTKVVNLLKEMQAAMAKEQEEDESAYQRMSCWCETNDKEKGQSISDAKTRIASLVAAIEEHAGQSARLATEIKNLQAEAAKDTHALEKATSLRRKELKEFNAEEKDMVQSIGALKSAITVLGKHHSLLQVPDEAQLSLVATLEELAEKAGVSKAQKKVVTAFAQASRADGKYEPQSGAIFGILEQMKETFETNLASSQKEEQDSEATFQDLKAAKKAEISAAEEQRDTKSQEQADTDMALAQAKQDLQDTRASLSADEEFAANLKEQCMTIDQEWVERQKTRAEEMEACSKAMAVLTSDEAHSTFGRTLGFVQVSNDSPRQRVINALRKGGPRLAQLTVTAKKEAFKKLVAKFDAMVVALKQQKHDEMETRDFCIKELNRNEFDQEMQRRDLEDHAAKIATLEAQVEALAKNIVELEAEIAEMEVQLKRAGEDREVENKEFQTTVWDQRATQKLLQQALGVLEGFYKKSFVQQTPPTSFKTYEKKNGARGGVLGMLEGIIAEAKQLEHEAVVAETDSQKAYESFVKSTNTAIGTKTRDLTSKRDEKAQAEIDLTAAQRDHEAGVNELRETLNENKDLHKTCDFTLSNFEGRQAALDQEMGALEEAKAVLSGSSFVQGFLQRK